MGRRTLLATLTGAFLASPLAVAAQKAGKVYRIGLLFDRLPSTFPGEWAFYERMKELDWVYGRDFVGEHRLYGDQYNRIPDLATELIRAGADIFIVPGAADAARVRQVTQTIPIVTWGAGDLVEAGLAASLARPGGNVTGVQTLQPPLIPKHLSLLKEAIPRLTRSSILFQRSPSSTPYAAALREAEAGGKRLGITLQIVTVHTADELEAAFSAFRAERAEGVVIVRNAFMGIHLKTLADLALKHHLPTISDMTLLTRRGGLMSYGFNLIDTLRSAADIVDKILHGAKVSEVPIQQATTFQLVINLRTAKALGLTIPPSLELRAAEVIR